DPAEIEIHSRDGLGRPTRPRVVWRGRLQPWAVSITHADPWVLVAVSRVPGVAVGVDLAPLENWSHGCAEMWLTPWERRKWHKTVNRRIIATMWAIKEAVYKAINRGESFTPTRIEVCCRDDGEYAYRWDGLAPRVACRIEVVEVGQHIAALVTVIASDGE